MDERKDCLISVEELNESLSRPDLVILDASVTPIGAQSELSTDEFIVGAGIFDIDEAFSQKGSHLPHTLLDPLEFQAKARELGINQNSHIVIYDQIGVYSACRSWWNFKLMGHSHVRVLNGGLPAWKAAGYAMAKKPRFPKALGDFLAASSPDSTVAKQALLENIEQKTFQVLDARSAGRFAGRDAEPRKGLRAGHVPGSISLPFNLCLRDGKLLEQKGLTEIFNARDVSIDEPIAFTCGSGLTACIVLLAAYSLGARSVFLYDGSWSEWGGDPSLPIEADHTIGLPS